MIEPQEGLGIVVNFYVSSSNEETRGLIVSITEVGLRLLVMNPSVEAVLLVDGSSEPCMLMQSVCKALGVDYHHAGRRLTYVEAYNIGWRMLPYTYIGLMANDIIPHPLDTIGKLLDWVKKPDVGCTFPYMNSNREQWDEVQRPGFTDRGKLICEPTTMTLNLNLFKRAVLEKIEGLDENYTAGYQEPILIVKIRSLGYRVVLVGSTTIFHFDRLTKSLGESHILDNNFYLDSQRWFQEYKAFASSRGIANIRTWASLFATSRPLQIFWCIICQVPYYPLRHRLIESLLWIEPWLCRYPSQRI